MQQIQDQSLKSDFSKFSWFENSSMELNKIPDLSLLRCANYLFQRLKLGKSGHLMGDRPIPRNDHSLLCELYNRCIETLNQRHPDLNFSSYAISTDEIKNIKKEEKVQREYRSKPLKSFQNNTLIDLYNMEDPLKVEIFLKVAIFKGLFKENDKSFFGRFFPSGMRDLIKERRELTMDYIKEHAAKYPKGKTAQTLKLLEGKWEDYVSPIEPKQSEFKLN